MKKIWILTILTLLLTGCGGKPAVTPVQTTAPTQPAPVFTPEAQVLYDKYQSLLAATDTTWKIPTAEELQNTFWYYDGYDEAGNFIVYEMKLHKETMDIRWLMPDGEEKTWQAAPWKLETRENMGVLTMDLQDLAGIQVYNLLINPAYEMMYIGLDVTSGDLLSRDMPQFRFLLKHVELQPEDTVGHWARTHTGEENNRIETEKGDCAIHITNMEGEGFRFHYTSKISPEETIQNAEMTIIPPVDMDCFANCDWVGRVKISEDTLLYMAVRNGVLMLVNCRTEAGTTVVSYEWFSQS